MIFVQLPVTEEVVESRETFENNQGHRIMTIKYNYDKGAWWCKCMDEEGGLYYEYITEPKLREMQKIL